MKVNKVSNWIYWILMLLPFLYGFVYVLVIGISRNQLPQYFNSISDFHAIFNEIWGTDLLAWTQNNYISSTISDYGAIFGINGDTTYFDNVMTYLLTISVWYLGIEILLAFINIVRKLIYSFVDKEF